ncbi:MAG: hypothetical protein LBB88_03520 [Planctomycetaceae bacterium]|jgi:hypothetical protein|nr:hypothetical protein [Planctomycetaceae bacterium]
MASPYSRNTSINDANYSYDSTAQLIGAESDNQAPTKPKIVQKYIYLLALLTIKFNSLTLIFENIRVSSN